MKKQLLRLKKVAKKFSPEGRMLRAAVRNWLTNVAEQRRMRRFAGRLLNRAVAGAFNTWAGGVLSQRGLGAKLRSVITKGTASDAVCKEMERLLAAGGAEASQRGR